MLGKLVCVRHSGKQALDVMMLDMGRMVAEGGILMERKELLGPEYDPADLVFWKWVHEAGSIHLGDQKAPVTRPRLRHIKQGEVTLQSYAYLHNPGAFSEELPDKTL